MDIAKELRQQSIDMAGYQRTSVLLDEAAAEIERLRRALVAVQEAAELGDTDACHEIAFSTLKKIKK